MGTEVENGVEQTWQVGLTASEIKSLGYSRHVSLTAKEHFIGLGISFLGMVLALILVAGSKELTNLGKLLVIGVPTVAFLWFYFWWWYKMQRAGENLVKSTTGHTSKELKKVENDKPEKSLGEKLKERFF